MKTRMLRADSEIKQVLSEIILYSLKDPRFSENITTITWVKTSSDFTSCKVGVSVLNKDINKRKEIIALLTKSSGYIKRQLSERLALRAVPNIVFSLDDGSYFEDKIGKILEDLIIPKDEETSTNENDSQQNTKKEN